MGAAWSDGNRQSWPYGRNTLSVLSCVEHGAAEKDDRGGERRATPQAADALVVRHSADGVPDAAVVAALGKGQAPVRLHPHHGHVGRVADGRTDAARDEPRRDLAVQGEHVSVLLLLHRLKLKTCRAEERVQGSPMLVYMRRSGSSPKC